MIEISNMNTILRIDLDSLGIGEVMVLDFNVHMRTILVDPMMANIVSFIPVIFYEELNGFIFVLFYSISNLDIFKFSEFSEYHLDELSDFKFNCKVLIPSSFHEIT